MTRNDESGDLAGLTPTDGLGDVWVNETLDEAIRRAKIQAGLDPEHKWPARDFYEFIGPQHERAFWERNIRSFFRSEGVS